MYHSKKCRDRGTSVPYRPMVIPCLLWICVLLCCLLSRGEAEETIPMTLLTKSRSTVDCPCSDPTLCQTITTIPEKEILIFSVSSENWMQYDWDHITTVAMFHPYDPKLMCYAHSKGVRVVQNGGFSADLLKNNSARTEWVMNAVNTAIEHHMDGVNLDIEFALDAKDAPLLTSLVQMTAKAFRDSIPHSQVTFDVAWSPNCIDLRCYDHKAIAEVVDYIFVMSYDEQSQIQGPCIAKANSPYDKTAEGVQAFIKLGIPPKKLVLGVPWYGYNYPCLEITKADVCSIKKVPFRGVDCSDAAGSQKGYGTIMKLLANNATSPGRKWNAEYKAPYFDYKNQETNQMTQVWYDDPESLQLTYDYAKKVGMYGVGTWNGDTLDYSDDPVAKNQTKAMWDAMASFLKP